MGADAPAVCAGVRGMVGAHLEVIGPSRDPDLDVAAAHRKFSAARFDALYRLWLQRGAQALWALQTPILRDQLQRGEGRIEFAELPHQYLQLTPLIGGARDPGNGAEERANLTTA